MSHYLFSDAQIAKTILGSFVDRDMVMRHFGGGIGHLQSTHRGEQVFSETASIGEDEDDLGGPLDDNSMELDTVSHSSADEDFESELDTDDSDNGYDSL